MSTIAIARAKTHTTPSAKHATIRSRLRALSASSFELAALDARFISLDLSGPAPAALKPRSPETGGLATCLAEAGLALVPGRGLDVSRLPGHRVADAESAGEALGLALFLLTGARGRAEGSHLDLVEPARGLSARDCRILEDRLAWLAANAVLVGHAGEGAGSWLKRLAAAFQAETSAF